MSKPRSESLHFSSKEITTLLTSSTNSVPAHLVRLAPPDQQYMVYFSEETKGWAKALEAIDNTKYVLARQSRLGRFADGTLDAELYDLDQVRDRHVIYLASYSSYERLYEDYACLIVLTQSFCSSMTLVLPFMASATMERVQDGTGVVATANIDSWMLQTLPCPGRMNRIIILDIHTLGNKFYFSGTAMADLLSAVPSVYKAVKGFDTSWAVAFPDDGASKRFGGMFGNNGHELVICAKVRDGDKRVVTVKEGSAAGKHVLIVDDLVQSGGTLIECMKVLFAQGALSVNAFVTHAVFPKEKYKRFLPGGGEGERMTHFYTTNSRPTMAAVLAKYPERFTIVDIAAILHNAL